MAQSIIYQQWWYPFQVAFLVRQMKTLPGLLLVPEATVPGLPDVNKESY
ncbi:MAG: hypothetical protein ACI90V_000897 [Bacillariaceae sp.]|jgi:hypothetical protein